MSIGLQMEAEPADRISAAGRGDTKATLNDKAPFCAYVAQLGFWQSANLRGPGDNAHAESFFHSLKAELTRGVQFPTEHALRTQLAHYIRYYNTVRFHSSLGYQSPIEFERNAA
jgi:hypothetical protein